MNILTAEQIRELDKFTIEKEPIRSVDLMERAASKCTEYLLGQIKEEAPFLIICGMGNNGGDGLVIARKLHLQGRNVSVVIVKHSEKGSADFEINLEKLKNLKEVSVSALSDADDFPKVGENTIIIDAILGTGLSKPLHGLISDVAQRVNALPNGTVSIDMPTGLFAEDNAGNNLENVIHADHTLSFHCPKLSFLLPDSGALVGEMTVLDIGLMEKQMEVESPFRFVELIELKPLYRPREKFTHKGTYGHALLMAGSLGKMGAA